jgi:hypothetical protein
MLGTAVLSAPLAASADTWEELTALSSVFPANTDVYIGLRTDDDYIAALDAVLQQINRAVDAPDPQSLYDILDEAAASLNGGVSFAETIRPAIGDEAAFAVGDMSVLLDDKPDNDNAAELALAVRLNAEGQNFIREQLDGDMIENLYEITDEDGILYYRPLDPVATPAFIYATEEVLVITSSPRMLPISREARLSTRADLGEAFEGLPEDEYNIIAWIDVSQIFSAVIGPITAMGEAMPELEAQIEVLEALEGAYLSQVWGFTILDDRSFTIDLVQRFDPALLAQSGLSATMISGLPAFDQAFLGRIPSGSAAVIVGTGLDVSIDAALLQLQGLGEEGETLLRQVDVFVRGITGQNLEEIAEWATGNYALVTTPLPELMDLMTGAMPELFPIDFGLVVETSDPAASARFVENLFNTVGALPQDQGATLTAGEDTLAGVEVDTITITAPDLPFPIEIVFASTDEVVAIGTRGLVTAALDGEADFAADAATAEALTYVLPGSSTFLYLGGEAIAPIGPLLTGTMMSGATATMPDTIGIITGVLSTATITTVTVEDSATVRMVWTLPAE